MNDEKAAGAAAARPGTEQAELVRMRAEQYQMFADLARIEVALRRHGERLLEQLNAFVEADAQRDATSRRGVLQGSHQQLRARHDTLRRLIARALKVAVAGEPKKSP